MRNDITPQLLQPVGGLMPPTGSQVVTLPWRFTPTEPKPAWDSLMLGSFLAPTHHRAGNILLQS